MSESSTSSLNLQDSQDYNHRLILVSRANRNWAMKNLSWCDIDMYVIRCLIIWLYTCVSFFERRESSLKKNFDADVRLSREYLIESTDVGI